MRPLSLSIAFLVAVPPAFVALVVILSFQAWGPGGHMGDIADAASQKLLIPLPVAASLSIALLLFIVAFALRMRAPLESDPEAPETTTEA